MEYNSLSVRIANPTPGAYDAQAIHHLYGLSPDLPTLPFCSDESLAFDPNCVTFDPPSPTPLTTFQIPRYRILVGRLLTGVVSPAATRSLLGLSGTQLYAYARAGTASEAAAAWQAALDGVRAPLTAEQLANPVYVAAADAITAFVYRELYLAPIGTNRTPVHDPAVIAALVTDGKNIVANLDGVRSFATRRLVVDALSAAQNVPAYFALLDARAAITAQLDSLSPADRALTQDLLARIDDVTTPYFR
jgi:hypothetical protein